MKTARDPESDQPYMRCKTCGVVVRGFNQRRRPCPTCLELWLEEQGVPFLEYVLEP